MNDGNLTEGYVEKFPKREPIQNDHTEVMLVKVVVNKLANNLKISWRGPNNKQVSSPILTDPQGRQYCMVPLGKSQVRVKQYLLGFRYEEMETTKTESVKIVSDSVKSIDIVHRP